MLIYVIATLLTLLALVAVVLKKTYSFLPSKELRRRAEHGDDLGAELWQAVAYGRSLYVFLWLIIAFAASGAIVLYARVAPPLFGFLTVILVVSIAFAWLPNSRLSSLGARLAAFLSPYVAKAVSFLLPVLQRIVAILDAKFHEDKHTRLYERNDLLELLEKQEHQHDNRFTKEELTIARAALMFGVRSVHEILIPRDQVVSVKATDKISPVFLDELHQTGHSRFPVMAKDSKEISGTLSLGELTDVSEGKGAKGTVNDFADKHVYYVHENDSIASALHAFYQTKHQLFVVINGFEEYVGIITIEDILRALLGEPGEHDFDMYETRSAVASKHKQKAPVVEAIIDESELDEMSGENMDTPEKSPDDPPQEYDDLEVIEDDTISKEDATPVAKESKK